MPRNFLIWASLFGFGWVTGIAHAQVLEVRPEYAVRANAEPRPEAMPVSEGRASSDAPKVDVEDLLMGLEPGDQLERLLVTLGNQLERLQLALDGPRSSEREARLIAEETAATLRQILATLDDLERGLNLVEERSGRVNHWPELAELRRLSQQLLMRLENRDSSSQFEIGSSMLEQQKGFNSLAGSIKKGLDDQRRELQRLWN
jgi:hypothetical protein